jgi:uncharacterized SAM-binding protein YcdF (DUF218 family)
VTFNYALSSWLLPPTSLILLTLIGVLILKRRRAIGIGLIVLSQLLLLALSMPVVANALVRTLEPPAASIDDVKRTQAIVVFGGGRNRGAIEWGGETVDARTLQRLRYSARLARDSGLPLYVTGGKPNGGVHAEGHLMRDILAREFDVPVKWVDAVAETTRDNARIAAQDLRPIGVTHVTLVTDAVHIPRARRALELAGLAVVPAATGYTGQRPFAPYQLIPTPSALRESHVALREWASQLHYWILQFID